MADPKTPAAAPPGHGTPDDFRKDVGLVPEKPGAEPPNPPGTVLPDELRKRAPSEVPKPNDFRHT